MECNINARGKAIRLLVGGMMALFGVVLIVLALLSVVGGAWVWPVAIAAMATGGFGVFEGAAGWCVVRAMGFRTRI